MLFRSIKSKRTTRRKKIQSGSSSSFVPAESSENYDSEGTDSIETASISRHQVVHLSHGKARRFKAGNAEFVRNFLMDDQNTKEEKIAEIEKHRDENSKKTTHLPAGDELQEIYTKLYEMKFPILQNLGGDESEIHPIIFTLHMKLVAEKEIVEMDKKHSPIGYPIDKNLKEAEFIDQIRTKLYLVLNHDGEFAGEAFSLFMMFLTVYSIVDTIIESVKLDPDATPRLAIFGYLRALVDATYIAEYILRLLSCNKITEYAKGWYRIADLLCLVPVVTRWFIPNQVHMVIGLEMCFRSLRLVRICTMPALSNPMTTVILNAIGHSIQNYGLVISFYIVVAVFFMGGLLYQTEELYPGYSLSDTMWLAFITMTTIGYGDYYCVTPLGRFWSMIVSVFGLMLISIILMVVSATFENLLSDFNEGVFILKEDIQAHGISAAELDYYEPDTLLKKVYLTALRGDYAQYEGKDENPV